MLVFGLTLQITSPLKANDDYLRNSQVYPYCKVTGLNKKEERENLNTCIYILSNHVNLYHQTLLESSSKECDSFKEFDEKDVAKLIKTYQKNIEENPKFINEYASKVIFLSYIQNGHCGTIGKKDNFFTESLKNGLKLKLKMLPFGNLID